MKNNNQVFFEKYKEFENLIRIKYKIQEFDSIVDIFYDNIELRAHVKKFNVLRNLRNYLGHKPDTLKDTYFVISKKSIEILEDLINIVLNPKKIKEICIPLKHILTASLNDQVIPYFTAMEVNKFNLIPIINEGRIIGVFTENSLLRSFLKEEIVEIDKRTTFHDIFEFTKLENRQETFKFISENMFVHDLLKEYKEEFKNNTRLGAYFITKTGSSSEPITGLITTYRLASFE